MIMSMEQWWIPLTSSCWTSLRWTNSGSECSTKVTLEIAISVSRRGENSGFWSELILFGWVNWNVLTLKSTKRSGIHIMFMYCFISWNLVNVVWSGNLIWKLILKLLWYFIYKISLRMNVYLIDWYFEAPEKSLTINSINYQNKKSYTGKWTRN